MRIILLVISAALFGFTPPEKNKTYNILNFGAKGDGVTLNTESIQAAIDKAGKDGGGQVIVPAGKFVTGTIVMKSGVELHIDANAFLLGSINPYDYPYTKSILQKTTVSEI